eukprot:7508745-Pyramimonas_sp.AAC.1
MEIGLGIGHGKEVKQPTLYSLRWLESTFRLFVSLLQEWQQRARHDSYEEPSSVSACREWRGDQDPAPAPARSSLFPDVASRSQARLQQSGDEIGQDVA